MAQKGSVATWLRDRLERERTSINAPASIEESHAIAAALQALPLDANEQLPIEEVPLLP